MRLLAGVVVKARRGFLDNGDDDDDDIVAVERSAREVSADDLILRRIVELFYSMRYVMKLFFFCKYLWNSLLEQKEMSLLIL